MDAVAIAVVIIGPLVACLLLLVKAIRKLMPQAEELPPWHSQFDEPPTGGHFAGNREPRRPLTPSRSGAATLALPLEDDGELDQAPVPPRHVPRGGGGDEGLAG